ncbi:TPA: hypothetical protein ACH3X3_007009 [Trebouxia sp. C0006]
MLPNLLPLHFASVAMASVAEVWRRDPHKAHIDLEGVVNSFSTLGRCDRGVVLQHGQLGYCACCPRSFCSRDPHPDAQTPCNKVDGVHLDMSALDSELLLYNCSPSSVGYVQRSWKVVAGSLVLPPDSEALTRPVKPVWL